MLVVCIISRHIPIHAYDGSTIYPKIEGSPIDTPSFCYSLVVALETFMNSIGDKPPVRL